MTKIIVQSPNGVVMPVSAEIAVGSGYALQLTRDEAMALCAASERWRALNPVIATHVAKSEREDLHEVVDDGGIEITIKVRRRG